MKKVLLFGGIGLVGRHIHKVLKESYDVVITSKNHEVENGYKVDIEDIEFSMKIVKDENPDIVISSLGGKYEAQLKFHEKLANWIKENNKKLIYISTANVFDNDYSKPMVESDPLNPASEYGIFKKDCEKLITNILPDVVIFRLCAVWASDANRLEWLTESSKSGKPAFSLRGDTINITYADQIGEYAKYVLDHDLTGIFHVGSTDMMDWHSFNETVCEVLGIENVTYNINDMEGENYQAVLPNRPEIPESLQLTIKDILNKLKETYKK